MYYYVLKSSAYTKLRSDNIHLTLTLVQYIYKKKLEYFFLEASHIYIHICA